MHENSFCPRCNENTDNKFMLDIIVCSKCFYVKREEMDKMSEKEKADLIEQEKKKDELRDQQRQAQIEATIAANKAANIACCPKCGSTSIATINKGYGLVRGFLGSGKPMNVCQMCGHKWKPGT